MKQTIHELMTVDRRPAQRRSDADARISEIPGRAQVCADPRQGRDDVQRWQVRHHVHRRPLVAASSELIGNAAWKVVALHTSDEFRSDAVEGISR